ncbi:MAG TPA: ATP-binding protein [Dongiaceae bacterium]|nr:ATP-binding protein [Dongiaceae bacterium]
MRRIAGLSNKKPLKKPAARVRKAPPKRARRAARKRPAQVYCSDLLGRLFRGYRPEEIKIQGDRYPAHMRANLQPVIEELLMANADQCVGAIPRYSSQNLELSELMSNARDDRIAVGPISRVAVDTGEDEPVRCVRNALILKSTPMPHAIFIFVRTDSGGDDRYIDVDIAVPRDHPGSEAFADQCFAPLEEAIEQCRAYRGKVLSLEKQQHYSGRVGGIQVHRLKPVQASEVILPAPTRALLDRCVLDFMKARGQLRSLGFQTKRGILLYGPPGTGKTHTIRYLASNLAGTTTFLVTAEQVGLLPHYMSLARLLQPSMVVIEDVDLIARSRDRMRSGCDESLLNSLLNEMDGLKENSDVLFILTTNRPQDLEAALANRPGRIDQAIEVPVPDAPSRDKLVRLYGNGLKLGDALVAEVVKRTEGVSAAFIKELMRRTAQAAIARAGAKKVTEPSPAREGVQPTATDLGEALDDMLFSGGALNVKLLGGAAA